MLVHNADMFFLPQPLNFCLEYSVDPLMINVLSSMYMFESSANAPDTLATKTRGFTCLKTLQSRESKEGGQ
jgi:hypothetical protein